MDTINDLPDDALILLWSAIPCTGGCPWTQVNLLRFAGFRAKLNQHFDLWNKLFDNFAIVAKAVLARGGHLALEWPSR